MLRFIKLAHKQKHFPQCQAPECAQNIFNSFETAEGRLGDPPGDEVGGASSCKGADDEGLEGTSESWSSRVTGFNETKDEDAFERLHLIPIQSDIAERMIGLHVQTTRLPDA